MRDNSLGYLDNNGTSVSQRASQNYDRENNGGVHFLLAVIETALAFIADCERLHLGAVGRGSPSNGLIANKNTNRNRSARFFENESCGDLCSDADSGTLFEGLVNETSNWVEWTF